MTDAITTGADNRSTNATRRRTWPMSLWHLEWLRLVRTSRWLALVGVFVFFGATSPPLNKYMATLVEHLGNGVQIVAPTPSAVSGFETYTRNAGQLGLLVFVLVVSSAVAMRAHFEMAVFLRTRCSSARQLLLPRFVVTVGAGVVAYMFGVLACWYGTVVLLGSVDLVGVVAGAVLGSLYLVFIGALAAAFGSVLRSVVTTAVATLAVALALGIAGAFDAVAAWLPGHLNDALADVAGGGDLTAYTKSAVVTVGVTAVLLIVAARGVDRQEL
jgi:ABC-2 type transport system permease protein